MQLSSTFTANLHASYSKIKSTINMLGALFGLAFASSIIMSLLFTFDLMKDGGKKK